MLSSPRIKWIHRDWLIPLFRLVVQTGLEPVLPVREARYMVFNCTRKINNNSKLGRIEKSIAANLGLFYTIL
jgi:hypothetical protein